MLVWGKVRVLALFLLPSVFSVDLLLPFVAHLHILYSSFTTLPFSPSHSLPFIYLSLLPILNILLPFLLFPIAFLLPSLYQSLSSSPSSSFCLPSLPRVVRLALCVCAYIRAHVVEEVSESFLYLVDVEREGAWKSLASSYNEKGGKKCDEQSKQNRWGQVCAARTGWG